MSEVPVSSPDDRKFGSIGLLSEFKNRIDSVLTGRDDLVESHAHIQAQSSQLRLERADIDRRMRELGSKQAIRITQRQTFERELATLKKESMINDLLFKKKFELDSRKKIDDAESEELILLKKLEVIDLERKKRLECLPANRDGGSSLDLCSEIVADSNPHAELCSTDTQTYREIQNQLKASFAQFEETSILEKQKITLTKYELEAKLRMTTAKLRGLGVTSDETFALGMHEARAHAECIECTVPDRLRGYQSANSELQEENKWLDQVPSTEAWESTKKRIFHSVENRDMLAEESEKARQFLNSGVTRHALTEYEHVEYAKEELLLILFEDILSASSFEIIADICADVIRKAKISSSRTAELIAEAAVAMWADEIHKIKTTGRLFLCKGCLTAIDSGDNSSEDTSYSVKRTQYLSHGCDECVRHFHGSGSANVVCKKKLSVWKSMISEDSRKESQTAILQDMERTHWEKMRIHLYGGAALVLPPEIKICAYMKLFSRPLQSASLLATCSKTGRMAFWWIPWQETTVTLVTLSPRLPPSEEASITDMRESFPASNQVVTLDSKGAVRVWSLNPMSRRKKSHTRDMFPSIFMNFSPAVPACTFYVTPTEYNLPESSSFDSLKHADKRANYRSMIAPQPGKFPQKVIFFPSTSLSTRNSSVLIGTLGGDLLKINMDFKEKYFASHLTFPRRFTDIEYMHSASVTLDNSGNSLAMVQATGDGAKKGNMVYREVFHHHRYPIVFMDTVGNATKKLITIDSTGETALWKYDPQTLQPQGWFAPEVSVSLDLRWLSIGKVSSKSIPNPPSVPPPEVRSKLKVMRHRIISETAVLDVYRPVSNVPLHPPDIQVVFECTRIYKSSGSDAILEEWTSYNVVSSFASACVLGVHMTGDGHNIVLLINYTASRMSDVLPMKTDIVPTDDVFSAIISLDITNLEFHSPAVIFELERHELPLGIHIGPVLKNTLSRVALVNTNTRLRAFSLETGQELKSVNFPFRFESLQLNLFEPMLGAVCPLQQIAAFGSADDTRIAVVALSDKMAGDGDKESMSKSDSLVRELYKSSDQLSRLVYDVILPKPLRSKNIPSWLIDECHYCFNNIFNDAMGRVDCSARRNMIVDMCGDGQQGVVEPTQWPLLSNDSPLQGK